MRRLGKRRESGSRKRRNNCGDKRRNNGSDKRRNNGGYWRLTRKLLTLAMR